MNRWITGRRTLLAGLALVMPATSYAQVAPAGEEPAVPAYEVGRALPPADPDRPLAPLTLEDAVMRALEVNLDVQRVRLEPRIQEYALRVAYGAFSPTLNLTYGYNNATSQSTSQLDGGARTTTERQTFNMSVAKTLPWYGGRFTMSFNNSRTESNNVFTVRNPSYNSTLTLNFTQPLLAGFKTDNQRAAVETAEIQSQITDLQVRAQIENVAHQVRQAYWALRAAIEQIEIQRLNLAQAQRLLDQDRELVRLGRRTELQLLQSEAQVASAEQALLAAEIQWRNQELAFKRLIVSGPDDPLIGQTINPIDLPTIVDQEVDIDAAIQVALRERADIRQARYQRDISLVNLDVSRSNALPDLSLNASYSLQGVGGNLFERQGLGGEPVLVQPGGFKDGLQAIADRDAPTWNISLTASYPLGTNTARANHERAQLQLRQTELQLRAQELNIITQVTAAGLAVRNTYLQLEAARRNREAAERNAEAELLRFQLGAATAYEVTAAQNQLTSARLSELQATINHINAIAEFERVQYIGG